MCLAPYGIFLYKKLKLFALLVQAFSLWLLSLLPPSSKVYSCFRVLVFLYFRMWRTVWWLSMKMLISHIGHCFSSVQFISTAQSCPILWNPMNCSTPGFPVHHQLLEFTQTHVHIVSDAIQQSHPLSSPFPPAPNPSQHQSLFQWVNSSHEVVKVLEFQL